MYQRDTSWKHAGEANAWSRSPKGQRVGKAEYAASGPGHSVLGGSAPSWAPAAEHHLRRGPQRPMRAGNAWAATDISQQTRNQAGKFYLVSPLHVGSDHWLFGCKVLEKAHACLRSPSGANSGTMSCGRMLPGIRAQDFRGSSTACSSVCNHWGQPGEGFNG